MDVPGGTGRPRIEKAEFARRRKALGRQIGAGNALVVSTHPPALFSNDVTNPFRPQSDFWYLTGFGEPDAVALIESSGRTTLWLQPRDPASEIWDGRRLGVERAKSALGVQEARPSGEVVKDLATRLGGFGQVYAILGHDVALRARVKRAARRELAPGSHLVADMRIRKSPEELRVLRKACQVGMDAMEEAARSIRPGGRENHVAAALIGHYLREGSEGWGYPPIVGAGANAAVLHYTENRDAIKAGDLVLIDAGCSWHHYTCDITRTFPASGRFDTTQAALYDIVAEARKKALAKIRPGETVRAPHEAAARTITEGLVAMGHLKGHVDDLVAEHAYRAFFMHGTSHYLGIDVHDAGAYKDADGAWRRLEEGMVLTVEPGLYYNPDYATCPPGTAGTGIRIEDDVAVTETGRSVLTSRLPTDRDAVEAMVA